MASAHLQKMVHSMNTEMAARKKESNEERQKTSRGKYRDSELQSALDQANESLSDKRRQNRERQRRYRERQKAMRDKNNVTELYPEKKKSAATKRYDVEEKQSITTLERFITSHNTLVVLCVVAVTALLVFMQQSIYAAQGVEGAKGWALSLICEGSMLVLAAFLAVERSRIKKAFAGFLLVGMFAYLFQLASFGIDSSKVTDVQKIETALTKLKERETNLASLQKGAEQAFKVGAFTKGLEIQGKIESLTKENVSSSSKENTQKQKELSEKKSEGLRYLVALLMLINAFLAHSCVQGWLVISDRYKARS